MKNTQEFLERFNRWKNGAPIQELYKAGRPVKFDDGKDVNKEPKEDPALRAALRAAIDYKLSLAYDTYNEGKDVAGSYNFNAIQKVAQNAPLSYGSYYDLTGDVNMDNRLPKYVEGKPSFDDNIAIDYIGQLENADRVGLKNGIWRTPKIKGYDPNQIGMGLDIREEHNPIVYNYLKTKGRLNDPWLTEKEERDLRMKTWRSKKRLMNKFVERHGDDIDQMGYNRVAGMLWHGHPFKQMNDPTSITGRGLEDSIAGGDRSLEGVFNAYYGYKGNAIKYKDRVRRDANFAKQYTPKKNVPATVVEMLEQNPTPQFVPQPVNPYVAPLSPSQAAYNPNVPTSINKDTGVATWPRYTVLPDIKELSDAILNDKLPLQQPLRQWIAQ